MKLLLIEDSQRLQRSLTKGFLCEGFEVDVASDGLSGYAMVEAFDYDVVILDLMLPGMNGLTVLRRMRSVGKRSHVLILSAKDQVGDRIRGLEMGADDYMIKPFDFRELLARVRALRRREYQKKDTWIKIGGIQVNTASRTVHMGSQPLELTPMEFALLNFLLMRRGQVISRDQLIQNLYEGHSDIASNVIDVVICTLRKKIQPKGKPTIIKTRRGAGYYIG